MYVTAAVFQRNLANPKSSFLPSIVVGLGFEGSKAQLMSFPPHAIGAICEWLHSPFKSMNPLLP